MLDVGKTEAPKISAIWGSTMDVGRRMKKRMVASTWNIFCVKWNYFEARLEPTYIQNMWNDQTDTNQTNN